MPSPGHRYFGPSVAGLLLAQALLSGLAATPPPAPDQVRIQLHREGVFRDVQLTPGTVEANLILVSQNFGKVLRKVAAKRLAPGETLVVTFREIDLVGAVRAGTTPILRITGTLYPGRIGFDWEVLGADGAVRAKGDELLVSASSDEARLQRFPGTATELVVEGEMLRNWALRALDKPQPAKPAH